MATRVFVNAHGMVQHSHPGQSGWGKNNWHDPAKKHPELHKQEKAEKPTNLGELEPTQLAQYQAALKGESWYAINLARSAKARNLPEGELHAKRTPKPAPEPVKPAKVKRVRKPKVTRVVQEAEAIAASFEAVPEAE